MQYTVSIHALLAECDSINYQAIIKTVVSIHALLAECDHNHRSYVRTESRFNPRTPCGVRLEGHYLTDASNLFQSTHSLRSATKD